ncbi:MAG: hypothetical protein ACFFAJ_02565 [Candidatus Hodarchaeota archaeon]
MINVSKITRNKVFVGLILSLFLILLTTEGFSVNAEPQTPQSAYDLKNRNNTPKKAMIIDPTGKTEGYILEEFSDDFFELMGSRDQSSRHFYNKRTGAYTYQSDHLVQKEGVFEETAWVTAQEYPYRFILRLRNGTMQFFEEASDISTYLNTIERDSIWAVGFESFAGVMGFYLNLQDSVHGHGQ